MGAHVSVRVLLLTLQLVILGWAPRTAAEDFDSLASACTSAKANEKGNPLFEANLKGTRARPKPLDSLSPVSYSTLIGGSLIDSFDPQSYPVAAYAAMEEYLAGERDAGRLSDDYGLVDFLTFGEASSLMDSVISANRLADAVFSVQLGVPLVWREAKDSYVVSSWLNMADIHVIKTGVRESDGAHLFTMIDTGTEPLVRDGLLPRSAALTHKQRECYSAEPLRHSVSVSARFAMHSRAHTVLRLFPSCVFLPVHLRSSGCSLRRRDGH